MNIYFRTLKDNKLGLIQVDKDDYEEARLLVKEDLVASGEGFQGAVVALIHGGQNAKDA